jgi:hypothetical protein
MRYAFNESRRSNDKLFFTRTELEPALQALNFSKENQVRVEFRFNALPGPLGNAFPLVDNLGTKNSNDALLTLA